MSNYAPWATTLGIWIAAGLTIAVYSFLYKDNPFYKLAEHLFIGASTGYIIVIAWNDALRPILVEPLIDPRGPSSYYVIIPGLMGLLMFSRFFKGMSWISRIPLAFLIGYGAGVAAPANIQAYIIRHTGATITPLFEMGFFSLNAWSIIFGIVALAFWAFLIYSVEKDRYGDFDRKKRTAIISGVVLSTILFLVFAVYWPTRDIMKLYQVLFNLSMITGTITVLFYFFYSIEHKKSLKGVAKAGILYLMVFFGTSFGYTVMGRVSLAIGRMQFLYNEWWKESTGKQWGVAALVVIAVSVILFLSEKSAHTEEK